MTGDDLLALPVRSRGIRLGFPVDLIVDLDGLRVVGLEVQCGDDVRRVLPLAAAAVGVDEIAVPSALMLFDELGAAFYRERASALSRLRGSDVELNGRPVGALRDVVVSADGSIEAFVVEHDGRLSEVEPGPRLRVGAVATAA